MNTSWPLESLVDALWRDACILVIAPHPDDETFGCAGTLAKAKALGSRVFILYVTVGDVTHVGRGEVGAQTRCAEVDAATRTLGIDGYEIVYRESAVHMRLDTVPRRELITRIEAGEGISLARTRPDVLLLPAPSYNQDHRAVCEAGFAATRPHLRTDKHFPRVVMTYEQPQLSWGLDVFRPNLYVDISRYLATKLRAHACHRSQLLEEPHSGSLSNVERLARLRGSEVATEAAEAFCCYRLVA